MVTNNQVIYMIKTHCSKCKIVLTTKSMNDQNPLENVSKNYWYDLVPEAAHGNFQVWRPMHLI